MARTAPADPAREAWGAIAHLFLSDENHQRFHEACESVGVTPPALKALLSLAPGQAESMRGLATAWRCDASWVTSLVDTLEEQGLVERRVMPTDRRVKTISLTPAGERAKVTALDHISEPPASMKALTRAEQVQLRDLLRKFVATQGD